MATTNIIPQGEEKITVELTVKEAMALSGQKFAEDPELLFSARKKVKGRVDSKLLHEEQKTTH